MRRDDALMPLSRNHHDGLVLAKRMREALERGSPPIAFLKNALRESWERDLSLHFAAEEEILAPAVRKTQDADALAAVERMVEEHRAIRATVERALIGSDGAALAVFADLLTEHIRFEERELFESAQRVLSDETLRRVGERIQHAAPPNRACPIPSVERG